MVPPAAEADQLVVPDGEQCGCHLLANQKVDRPISAPSPMASLTVNAPCRRC
jgi:hypothetical protein